MSINIQNLPKTVIVVLFVFLALIMWGMGSYSVPKQNYQIPNIIEEYLDCSTKSTNNADVFTVFVDEVMLARNILGPLCANEVINKQFGKVRVYWSGDESETIQYVGKGIADLALVKENIMQAFAAQTTHGYTVTAYYEDYDAYLISLKEKPQITKEYLLGKKLGLLDYASSRSGHIVPKRMLKELNLTPENITIVYANSHESLRDLLSSGQVDMIASYWQNEDEQQFSRNYISLIQTKISGTKWYLKMETQNTDLLCSVQNTLIKLAAGEESHYHNRLILSPDCPNPALPIVGH